MQIRAAASPQDVKTCDTARLRKEFLVDDLFTPDAIPMVYSHIDRIIVGSAVPASKALTIASGAELHTAHFLDRREMGLINIGGEGTVIVDGDPYTLRNRDGLYIGMGAKEIRFSSQYPVDPARFYFNSAPAHRACPTVLIKPETCARVELGTMEESNHRTICKYILPGQVDSC
jgi:4-deoxy-L-threo-5-hexosulose-uronate ketol-isomerase